MSRTASGDFGGAKRPPAEDGLVTFEVYKNGEKYVATGGEPNSDGEGRGPTAAVAIADYCQKYNEATTAGESEQ